jgi:hypothetical protein
MDARGRIPCDRTKWWMRFWKEVSPQFAKLYSDVGRPSIEATNFT